MVLTLSNKTIELNLDKTFTIKSKKDVLKGTYIKSVLDTNKFIVTFKTDNKDFLIYFDLDSKTVIGNTIGVQKLKSVGKQSFESFFRYITKKLCLVIKGLLNKGRL